MTYFVRLGDSNELRRTILEGGKELIEGLKGYELILELRDQKKEVVQDIQKVMNDLHELLTQLEDHLPAKSLKEVEQYLPKEKPKISSSPKTVAVEKPKSSTKAPPISEAHKLNQTLALIEQRLSELK